MDRCAVLSTIDVPSRNLARKSTLAFVKRPSLSETTMNWEPLNRVRNSCPICCVCDRSKAASISSRIYIGAGLNWRRDMMRERAINDLCYIPSWVRLFFFFVASEHAPLSTTQFSQTLFPHWTELNFDFQTIHKVLTVGRLKFRKVTRKKFCKDLSEIPKKKRGFFIF